MTNQIDNPNFQGKVKTKSNESTRIFGLNYLLSKDAVAVLRGLGEEKPQSIIAKEASFSKQKVNYWAKFYLERGLIREKSIGKPKIYTLTAVGQTILTRSDGSYSQPVIMEDFPVKFQLIRDNSAIDWKKLGEPKNWEKLGVLVGNVRVEKTSQNIIIHSGQIPAINETMAILEAGNIQAIVRAWLLDHGVELAPFGVPCYEGPVFKFYNKDAALFNQLYGTVKTEDGSIDHSPPDNVPHVEFKGPRTAANYIDMGNRVERMENDIKELKPILEAAVKALEAMPAIAETVKQNSQVIERIGTILQDLSAPRVQDANRKDPMLV